MPLRARMLASVADPGGRVVRENFTVPVRLNDVYLGMKPTFENRRAGQSGEVVGYDVIALNGNGQRVAVRGVQWQIVREDWNYDWYLDGGQWRWRRTAVTFQLMARLSMLAPTSRCVFPKKACARVRIA